MATCEKSHKTHTCRGPLFLIEENKKRRVFCLNSVKYMLLSGRDIEIIEVVPRKLEDAQKFIPDF